MGIETNTRSGTNTTELMQKAFEDSGYIEKGHGQKLAWHEGLETYEQANEARKDAAMEPAKIASEHAKELAVELAFERGAQKAVGKEVVERAGFGTNPVKTILTNVAKGAVKAAGGEAIVAGSFVVAGGVTIAAAAMNMRDGDRMNDHMNTIALELATTQLLKLDPDFRHSVFKHYEGNIEPDTVMKKFLNPDGSLTPYGRDIVPKLQAACDDGCRAGFDAVRGGGLAQFLSAHPDIAARRQKDVAFAKGFDQVIFAAQCGDGGHKLVQIKNDVDSRDVRAQSQAPVRG